MHQDSTPGIVQWTLRLEDAEALDRVTQALQPFVRTVFASGARGSWLRGDWLGHALHPSLTDVTLGTWTSATVLDLVGGRDSRDAARKLVAAGLLAAGPTAWTGWAQWAEAGPREKRVGLVHAVTNGGAIAIYAASWRARKQGRHVTGALLSLAGAGVSGVGGYLGSHLIAARRVATRDAAFEGSAALGGHSA